MPRVALLTSDLVWLGNVQLVVETQWEIACQKLLDGRSTCKREGRRGGGGSILLRNVND